MSLEMDIEKKKNKKTKNNGHIYTDFFPTSMNNNRKIHGHSLTRDMWQSWVYIWYQYDNSDARVGCDLCEHRRHRNKCCLLSHCRMKCEYVSSMDANGKISNISFLAGCHEYRCRSTKSRNSFSKCLTSNTKHETQSHKFGCQWIQMREKHRNMKYNSYITSQLWKETS